MYKEEKETIIKIEEEKITVIKIIYDFGRLRDINKSKEDWKILLRLDLIDFWEIMEEFEGKVSATNSIAYFDEDVYTSNIEFLQLKKGKLSCVYYPKKGKEKIIPHILKNEFIEFSTGSFLFLIDKDCNLLLRDNNQRKSLFVSYDETFFLVEFLNDILGLEIG